MAKKKKTEESTPIEGLGDVVKTITNFLGFETCDDCEQRRQKLNKMFPFLKKNAGEITQEEIIYLRASKEINKIDTGRLTKIYNRVYKTNVKPCNCPATMRDLLDKLLVQIKYQEIQ